MKPHQPVNDSTTMMGSAHVSPDVLERLRHAHRLMRALNHTLQNTALLYFSASGSVEAIPVFQGTTIGRTNRSTSVVDSPKLSSVHFKLTLDASGLWTIEDMESKNGTLLNGIRLISPHKIVWGDIIEAGEIAFVLLPPALAG